MTTTAEVQEAGLRWRERCAANAGDAIAYLGSTEGPTEAQPWPASVESDQARQHRGHVSPCRDPDPVKASEGQAGKRQGPMPPTPQGPLAPPGYSEDSADLCGQYPSRHAPRSAPCSLLQPLPWAGMLMAVHMHCALWCPPRQRLACMCN
jgi:hypothetical protein